ncbi:hypothetical protein, partial [Klebsiella pneumoniae]|uniref:hypothetical protein n=1 Tax=Klebsiella pneumoniae TaxID=573 RepID=UPI003EC066D6
QGKLCRYGSWVEAAPASTTQLMGHLGGLHVTPGYMVTTQCCKWFPGLQETIWFVTQCTITQSRKRKRQRRPRERMNKGRRKNRKSVRKDEQHYIK